MNSFPCLELEAEEFVAELARADEKAFEVKVWSFLTNDKGWSCHNRVMPGNILWYFDDGKIDGDVKGVPSVLSARTLIYMSSTVPHTFLGIHFTNFSLHFCLYRKDVLLRLKQDFFIIPEAAELRDLMDRIYLTLKFKASYSFVKIRSLFTALVIEILNSNEDRSRQSVFSVANLREMNEYINKNIRYDLSPSDLAKQFNLNPDYFTRQFRRHFGCSPRAWLKNERINRARAQLSTTSDSIKEIAHSLGFGDQRFFSRQFKKATGKTPSEYRDLY